MTHLVTFAKEVDEDKVTPGVLGFIVFAAMALAVWGLMKSMNRHMGRVDFTEAPDPKAEPENAEAPAPTPASAEAPAQAAPGEAPGRGRPQQG
ncbi:hypothetical protein GCM10027074_38440 [Streptomyces deserti]